MTRPLHLTVCFLFLQATLILYTASKCRADELQYPFSIAVADSGVIFLADGKLPGIWRLEGNQLQLFFRGGKQSRSPLNAIRCLELDRAGRLLVGDSATRDVYRFDESDQPQPLTRQAAADQPADATSFHPGRIGNPMDIAVNRAGEIYVSDLEISRVMKLAGDGGEAEEIAQIAGCRGLFVDNQDNLWVVSTSADQLHRISPDGKQEVIVKGLVFEFPHTVVVDDQGTAYVCDGYAKAIWKVVPGSQPEKWVQGQPLINPVGMALHDGKLYVADPRAKAVFQIDTAGQLSKLEFAVQPE